MISAFCSSVNLSLSLSSSGHELPLTEWEYLPHVGPRPLKGFVGLKNAGATCYMNSVLQQLYMIAPIRNRVLQVEEPARDLVQQMEDEEKKEKEREANRKNKEEVCFIWLALYLQHKAHAQAAKMVTLCTASIGG